LERENHPVSRSGCHPSSNFGFGISDFGLEEKEKNHPVSRCGCHPHPISDLGFRISDWKKKKRTTPSADAAATPPL
jgi:hypothetical protein